MTAKNTTIAKKHYKRFWDVLTVFSYNHTQGKIKRLKKQIKGVIKMKKIDWNQQELKMLLNSNCIDLGKSLNHKTAVKNTNKEND